MFRCYEGDWKKEKKTRELVIPELRLPQKYKDVRFFYKDEDQVYEMFSSNLEWLKRIGKDPTAPCTW
jgi:hypothetical protein